MNTRPYATSAESSEAALSAHFQQLLPQVKTAWQAMRTELLKIGLGHRLARSVPSLSTMQFMRDSFDGGQSFYGEWHQDGQRIGNIIVHADGTLFVEVDVVLVHPEKPQWFVEAVTAWGKLPRVCAELKLLPMPA